MAVFKVTYFFQQGKYGWSETFYRDEADIQDVMPRAEALGMKRAAMLGHQPDGDSAYLLAHRVSDVAVQRDSLLFQYGPVRGTGITGSWTGSSFGADHPELALMLRAQSGSHYRRTIWLRGIPDLLWAEEGYKPDATWLARYNQWRTSIVNSGWKLRVVNKLNLPFRILSVVRIGVDSPLHVTTIGAHDFASGNRVRISGVRENPNLNGEWEVIFISPTTVAILGTEALQPLVSNPTRATIKRQEIVYVPMDEIIIREIRTRECGIPFGSPVGRRRPRLLTVL